MTRSMKPFLLTLAVSLLLINLTPNSADAIWQTALDEHFEEDQRNPSLEWPWFTDNRGGERKRWHYNPRPPHFRAEPNYTDYSWGIQDFIFNSEVVRDDEQAIWCAFTNQSNVNQPRWPEDDDYMNNQNAWAWWGPMDLSDAAAAGVSFWCIIDMADFTDDSLSVGVTHDRNNVTLDGDQFRENSPIGISIARGLEEWSEFYFTIDEMTLNGEDYSLFDEDDLSEVWFYFVWHSNAGGISGTGAFIDDVTIQWDDGLFDIYPVEQRFGYVVEGEETVWSTDSPEYLDSIIPMIEWDVTGVGETPEFTIECYIDGELFYDEERYGIAGTDSSFVSMADEAWIVPRGDHTIRWVLDSPFDEGGVIEETYEINNESIVEFTALWDPAPLFSISSPAEDIDAPVDYEKSISYTISDSNEADVFSIFFFVSDNIDGLDENPSLIFDYLMIGQQRDIQHGEGEFSWDIPRYYREQFIEVGTTYYIVGGATDGNPENLTVSTASGQLRISPASVDEPEVVVTDYALSKPYPNPFNSSVTIDYALPIADRVSLIVYDLSGRKIATLIDTESTAGLHSVNWSPNDLSAGVYLLELNSGGSRFVRKAVYMP